MLLLLVLAIHLDDGAQLGALFKARYAMAKGDYPRALAFCEQALVMNENDAEAAVLKLEVLASMPVGSTAELAERQKRRVADMLAFYPKFPKDYRFAFAIGEFLVSERQSVGDTPLGDPLTYLEQALTLIGEDEHLRTERGNIWYYIGLWQYHNNKSFQAARAFREVVALDPSAEWAVYYAARSLESSHQLRSALKFYEKYAAVADSDGFEYDTPLPYTLALLRLTIDPKPETCDALIAWLKDRKDSRELHIQAILRLITIGRFNEVLRLLEALPKSARDHNYYRMLAITRMSLHQYPQLQREILEVLPQVKDRTRRANLIDYATEAALCVGDFATVLRLRDENPETPGVELKLDLYAAFAQVLSQGGSSRWDEAIKRNGSSDLMKSIVRQVKTTSLETVAQRNLAQIAIQWRDWELALKQLGELYRQAPAEAEQSDDLAVVHYEMRDLDKAFALYERLLQNQPERKDLLNNYGYFLADSGRNLEQAISLIRRALEQEPEEGAYLDSLGWALFKLGRFEEAEGSLLRSLATDASDPERLEHLGDLYYATGRQELARETWSQAMEKASDNYLQLLDKLDPAL